MSRALQICAAPGCPNLTRRTYCATHVPRGRANRSPTTRAQRDGTGDYERNRRALLATATHCHWCGSPGTTDNPLTADHILPVAHGGSHHPTNLVAACKRCNSSRGAARGGGGPQTDPGGTVRGGAVARAGNLRTSEMAGL